MRFNLISKFSRYMVIWAIWVFGLRTYEINRNTIWLWCTSNMKVVSFVWSSSPYLLQTAVPLSLLGFWLLSGKLDNKYLWCFTVIASKKWLRWESILIPCVSPPPPPTLWGHKFLKTLESYHCTCSSIF